MLNLEQTKQLARTHLGIDRVELENIVTDHARYINHENKILAILHLWKTKEGDVTAKQLYHYLVKIDLPEPQLEKAWQILIGIFIFINANIIILYFMVLWIEKLVIGGNV